MVHKAHKDRKTQVHKDHRNCCNHKRESGRMAIEVHKEHILNMEKGGWVDKASSVCRLMGH